LIAAVSAWFDMASISSADTAKGMQKNTAATIDFAHRDKLAFAIIFISCIRDMSVYYQS
jgi:hypothetical protein